VSHPRFFLLYHFLSPSLYTLTDRHSRSSLCTALQHLLSIAMPPPDWLIYHPIHCAVICRPCGYAACHPGLYTHLLSHHPEILLVERRALVAHFSSLSLLPSNDFRPPLEPSPPVPTLPLYRDGYRCSICKGAGRTYLCRSRSGIRDHCKIMHKWINPRASGQSTAWAISQHRLTQPWVEGVPCQRLFLAGKGAGYFEVFAPPSAPLSHSTPPPLADRIQVQINRELAAQAEQLIRTQEEQRNAQRSSSEVS
jgi:hypothetical protein